MMNWRMDEGLCAAVVVVGLFVLAPGHLQSVDAAPALHIAQLDLQSTTTTDRYLLGNIGADHFAALKIYDANHQRQLLIKATLDEQDSPGPPAPQPAPTVAPAPATCTLGNDTFHVGDRWNPILPPFGVQVCVQCECIVRQRAFCYEAKVTCRRIYDDCPVLDACMGGRKPITVAGQCCKMCPERRQQQQPPTSNSTQAASKRATHDRVLKEYHTIMKTMPQCASREKDKKEKESEQLNKLHPPPSTPQPINLTSTHSIPATSSTPNNQSLNTLKLDQTSLVIDADQKKLGQLMAKKNRSEIIHFTLILID